MRTNYFRLLLLMLAVAPFFLMPGLLSAQQNGPGPGGGGDTALTLFETDDFSGSGICALCHSRLSDGTNDVSMDAHWRSTMMANAAKDPLWQAKISAEIFLAPLLAQEIQEKCSRCHMGMARYQAKTDGTPVEVLTPGFLDPNNYLHDAAMDGVSCTLCHQIRSDNLGSEPSYTGKYVIDTTTSPPNRVLFGPYPNPLRNPMQRDSGFLPTDHAADGLQLADSAHCGTCHTLYTPTVTAAGDIVGEFPEQTTYLEWKHSGDIRTCQYCHLPEASGSVRISNRPRWLAARSPFGQHHYVGGNTFMVDLLKKNATVLGVTAEGTHFDDTILRTQGQLKENTATLDIADLSLSDGTLTVTVDVTNKAGHKFPSGIPSRRAWLHVTVANAGGNIVFESGKPLPDGRIAGNAADGDPFDPLAYEPHYDLITTADQVQIYEPVMLNTDGDVTYTLLRADSYAKDNRLLPAGFEKDTAGADFAVYGAAAGDDDFTGGSDRIDYVIPGMSNAASVTVRLLFQALSYPFVRDLDTVDTTLVGSFMGMYDPAKNVPEEVAAITVPVP